MRTVSALDVRRRLGELLDAASAGERIVIERDRRPLAVLVSYEDGLRLEGDPNERRRRAFRALEELERFSERVARAHPEWDALPDSASLIREERSRDDPEPGQ